jgi:LysR family glycine cleavage system transcriptional activator
VEAIQGIATQPLRVAVEPAFAARWLVVRLGGFSAAYPEIELELEASDEMRVLGRDTDIAIRFLSHSARRPRGRGRRLFCLDSFPVVAPAGSGRGLQRSDGDVVGYRLLHDDDGSSWRSWFTAAGIKGYEQARHLHFNDYSLVLTAALRGQGVALSAPIYVKSELKTRRLIRLGRTRVRFGDYWLLEASSSATAIARAAFVGWLDKQIKQPSRGTSVAPIGA